MPSTEQSELADSLVAANEGRLLLSISEASKVTGFSDTLLRRAVYAGDVVASRAVENGAMRILATELARWLLESRKRSKPVTA